MKCTKPNSEKKIILGSASPRRRELLSGLHVEFTVDTENSFEETYSPDTEHSKIPQLMSEGKSLGFHRDLEEDEVLITSDTMVLDGKTIMGKPSGREDAYRMLRELSGHTHEVITAVTIRDCHHMETVSDSAKVTFRVLTDDEIYYYIDTCRPFDKAGAYGIQEWIGYAGITGIQGSYFTIMGFPVHLVYELLKAFHCL